MNRFFIAGLINIETTLAIEGFPLDYFPVGYPFFGIHTSVSGVGYNLAKALTVLGNRVDLVSLIGSDDHSTLVGKALTKADIPDALVLTAMDATPQSVILYEPGGRRQIHTDLKDIQNAVYPIEKAHKAISDCDLAVICNINFARPLLEIAKDAGKLIATDVHALGDLDDVYNQDFMAQADILFLSDESLPDSAEKVAEALMRRYPMAIVVIGLGDKGALLALRRDNFMGRFETVTTRPVVNTIGAGDALFSAFLDRYLRWKDPYRALQAAMAFASYKIGEKGAADGFLTGAALDQWVEKIEQKE